MPLVYVRLVLGLGDVSVSVRVSLGQVMERVTVSARLCQDPFRVMYTFGLSLVSTSPYVMSGIPLGLG